MHLRAIVTLLLVALWVPVTSHCALERAGLIPSDGCCAEVDESLGGDSSCDESCCAVEQAAYLPSDGKIVVDPPADTLDLLVLLGTHLDLSSDSERGAIFLAHEPPGWTPIIHRVRPPARAPTLG